ncbi:MAG: hypothetical protein AAGA96_08335 [Verrucomicrobiota bacterium]
MSAPAPPSNSGEGAHAAGLPADKLTKRDYFAVHLYQAVTANLSLNCSLQDKAKHAVDAADALIAALEDNPE